MITAKKRLLRYFCNEIINNFILSSKENSDYEELFKCFVLNYLYFANPAKSFASYPGFRSFDSTKNADDIEGFYRILPVMAAWISSGRSSILSLNTFGSIDVIKTVKEGILNAVTPQSSGYYGEIDDYDLKIIAASIIALAIWYLKDTLWISLTEEEKSKIAKWLNAVNCKRIADNNWHLFVVITNAVLKNLKMPYDDNEYLGHYLRHKSFYRGNGWYSDGPKLILNYYNAWEIHPYLIWIDQIDPSLDRIFIRKTTTDFIKNFIYFFSPEGFPIFGRSICYRMALPTPLVLAEAFGWSPLKKGQALSALNAIWNYFSRNGAIKDGLITQGYCKEDLDFLDNYSGPASCNWSLLSLAAAFTHPSDSAFWKETPSPLPVELSSYTIRLGDIYMTIVGEKASYDVSVRLRPNKEYSSIKRIHYSPLVKYIDKLLNFLKIKDTFLWKILPHRVKALLYRPSNTALKYGLKRYSSKNPFCRC